MRKVTVSVQDDQFTLEFTQDTRHILTHIYDPFTPWTKVKDDMYAWMVGGFLPDGYEARTGITLA